MTITCLNCGSSATDKYCQHCGQKTTVKRLGWHSLGEEVFHFFTHIEKGFLKTTGQLIIRPGTLFKNYLDGKRKTYQKPIGFLLIWITLFLLVFHFALSITHYTTAMSGSVVTYDPKTSEVMNKYRSVIEVMILPFLALTAWLVIARPILNYVEILAVSFYTISFLFIFLCLQFILSLLLGWNFRTNNFDLTTTIVYGIWAAYAAFDFYRKYNIRFLVPRVIAGLVINVFVYFTMVKLIVKLMIWLNIA